MKNSLTYKKSVYFTGISDNFLQVCEFFQSTQGNVNNIKIKMAGKEFKLNQVDHDSENVSDETISKSEISDEEIYFFSKKKKKKAKRVEYNNIRMIEYIIK